MLVFISILKKKLKRLLLAHGDCSYISNCLTKIPAVFRGVFKVFAVSQNSYIFIPRFFSEPLTLLCGNFSFRETLFEKHRFDLCRGLVVANVIEICVETRTRAICLRNGGSIVDRDKSFTALHIAQSVSKAHIASCSVGT
jgi:hypothetical protein